LLRPNLPPRKQSGSREACQRGAAGNPKVCHGILL
jgi:hypothetical protein